MSAITTFTWENLDVLAIKFLKLQGLGQLRDLLPSLSSYRNVTGVGLRKVIQHMLFDHCLWPEEMTLQNLLSRC